MASVIAVAAAKALWDHLRAVGRDPIATQMAGDLWKLLYEENRAAVPEGLGVTGP